MSNQTGLLAQPTIGSISNPADRKRILIDGHYNENIAKIGQSFGANHGGMRSVVLTRGSELPPIVMDLTRADINIGGQKGAEQIIASFNAGVAEGTGQNTSALRTQVLSSRSRGSVANTGATDTRNGEAMNFRVGAAMTPGTIALKVASWMFNNMANQVDTMYEGMADISDFARDLHQASYYTGMTIPELTRSHLAFSEAGVTNVNAMNLSLQQFMDAKNKGLITVDESLSDAEGFITYLMEVHAIKRWHRYLAKKAMS